jgi:predicted HAD superfamily phosphohydrolase
MLDLDLVNEIVNSVVGKRSEGKKTPDQIVRETTLKINKAIKEMLQDIRVAMESDEVEQIKKESCPFRKLITKSYAAKIREKLKSVGVKFLHGNFISEWFLDRIIIPDELRDEIKSAFPLASNKDGKKGYFIESTTKGE